MKTGRYSSSAVRFPIHAPLMPSASNTSGPTQHTDAPIPATTPATREPFAFSCAMCANSHQMLHLNSKLRTMVRKQGKKLCAAV